MLTIKKYPLSSKAIIFGSVAFLVGLGGAGMYIERYRQHENLVFGRQESVLGASDTRAATVTTASAETDNTQAASSSSQQKAASPQVTSDSAELGQQQPAASSPASTSTAAPTASTSTIEPGRGAGSTAEPATTADQSTGLVDTLQGSCLLSNCLVTTVQDTKNNLLGN